jgi:hypothetical protein
MKRALAARTERRPGRAVNGASIQVLHHLSLGRVIIDPASTKLNVLDEP